MRHFILVMTALLISGCFQPQSAHERQARTEAAQHQLNAARATGSVRIANPGEVEPVCLYGVIYYETISYGGARHYTLAISEDTLQPMRCSNGK